MKVSYITKYGGPEVIEFGELPGPVLTKEKVLVRVKAVSVNPVEFMIRRGKMKFLTGSKFPKVLGADFSGIVVERGTNVREFKEGDRIYGYAILFFGKPGVSSEFITVLPKRIRIIPDGLTFEEAASLPVAALTALNGLRKARKLEGKSLLINGAAGGVGHFAVQIAKVKGARITATCRTKNMDFVRQLGADEIIDYTTTDLDQLNRRFDIIFDVAAKMKVSTIRRLLNKKGIYLSTLFLPDKMVLSLFMKIFLDKKLTSANFRGKTEDFQEIEELLGEGKISVSIADTFSAKDTRQVFELFEKGGTRGKMVIKWD